MMPAVWEVSGRGVAFPSQVHTRSVSVGFSDRTRHGVESIRPPFIPRDVTNLLPISHTECRPGQPLHYGGNFLKTAGGAGKRIKAFEADQGVQHIDRLIDSLSGRASVTAGQAPDDNTQTLPSPFIPCP